MFKGLRSINSIQVIQGCYQLAQASVPVLLDLTIQRLFQTRISPKSLEYFETLSGIVSLIVLSRFSHFPWKISAGLYGVYTVIRVYYSRKTDEPKKPPSASHSSLTSTPLNGSRTPDSSNPKNSTDENLSSSSQETNPDKLLQKTKDLREKLREESEMGVNQQNSGSSMTPPGIPTPSSEGSALPSDAISQKAHDTATLDQPPAPPSRPQSTYSEVSPPAAQNSSSSALPTVPEALARAAEKAISSSSPKPNVDQLRLNLEKAQKAVQDFSALIKSLSSESRRHGKSITVEGAVIGGKKKDKRKCKLYYCDSHFFKLTSMRYEGLKKAGYHIPSDTLFFLMQIEYDKQHILETHFFPVSMLQSLNTNVKVYTISLSEILRDNTILNIKLQFESKQIQQLLTLKASLQKGNPIIEIADPCAPGIGNSMDGLGSTVAAALMQIGSTKCYLEPFKPAS